MVDRLHAAIGRSPAELRRFLLLVKRDCFNGRSLSRHCTAPQWSELERLDIGDIATRIVDLEERAALSRKTFQILYREERDRERRALLECVGDRSLLRGIALASPDLVSQVGRLSHCAFESYGRKEKKAERSLLRYVSRAALKLSPFSTLTRVALGTAPDDPEMRQVRLSGSRWRERSLFRVKRLLLDQIREVLLRLPSLRAYALVSLNDTAEEVEPGRFRLLVPSRWVVDAETGTLKYAPISQVKVPLSGPVIPALMKRLAAGPVPHGELVAGLEREFAGEGGSAVRDEILSILEGLTSAGFLQVLAPWPSFEPHLERRLPGFLKSLPPDPALAPVIEGLEYLLALEDSFPATALPAQSIAEIDEVIDSVWAAAARASGLDPQARLVKGTQDHPFHEDVLLEGEVLEIPRCRAEEIFRHAAIVSRFASLYNHRHDVLHGIAALMAERWPGRKEVGFLDLFYAAQPLWRDYQTFDAAERNNLMGSFNPLGLQVVQDLHSLREGVFRDMLSLVQESSGGQRLVIEDVETLLQRVPDHYGPLLGPCVFVQPADADGNIWVLNRVFEGTGRYGSRYTAVMDEQTRRRYTDQLTDFSVFDLGGERAALLDLMFNQGNTVNLHWPQTWKVLEIPGELLDLPPERCVHLRDLRVRIDGSTGLPCLYDGSGLRLLPVYLSAMNNLYMPMVLKFLSVFGPFETRQVLPSARSHEKDGVTVSGRLGLGNLVLRRARWTMPAALLAEWTHLDEADAYAALNTWRLGVGIPERVFLLEKVSREGQAPVYKPQYIDFSSPLFTTIFFSAAKAENDRIMLEECLPVQEAFPRDAAGERWAAELQLDSLAFKDDCNVQDSFQFLATSGRGALLGSPMEALQKG